MPLELMIAVPVSRRISLLLESLVSKVVSNPHAHMCPLQLHTSTSNTGNAQLLENPMIGSPSVSHSQGFSGSQKVHFNDTKGAVRR